VGGQVATDSSGFAAWPNSASSASVEGPGLSFETRPSNSQDLLVSTVGVELSVNRPADTPDPTTTTTVAPTTTTTVAPTTTTTVASTTTTTVASTTTTTGPEFLPATGVSSKTNWLFFGAILIGSGVLLVTGARRSEPRRSQ
jgi:LPXTG-motif cell wall-anchored protein